MEGVSKLFKKQITITCCSILLGLAVAALILAGTGYDPLEVFGVLFKGMFSKPKYIVNIIIKSTPIILTGLSVVFAFKVGMFNIAAEGEFIIGTIAAVVVGILFDFPPYVQYPLVVLSGAAAGGIYGAIIGFLKAKFGIHEVITGIMFNWIAFYAANFVVNMNRFHQSNSPSTNSINDSGTDFIYNWKMSESGREVLKSNPFLMEAVGKTDINIGFIIAILVAFLVWIVLKKTTKGFELRAVGFNKDASEFSGINVKKNIVHALLISGAIAGLAGSLTIVGVSHKLFTMSAMENYGFNGLSVAMLAGSSPIGTIFAGLLFAGLFYGGGTIQSTVGAPSEIIDIMVGTIVFFVAIANIFPMFIDKISKRGGKHVK
jgi:ABC-type uncharacterized transport system permease subunit